MFSDKEILIKIKNGGSGFEEISLYLFNEYQGYLLKVKQKLGLSKSDTQDAYSDALIKLIRHCKEGKFKEESKLSTYFYSIFYNTAVDVVRKKSSNKDELTLDSIEFASKERDLLELINIREEYKLLKNKMGLLGGQCRKILIDWGFHGYDMTEIAIRSNLSNAESARSMKYKCLKKLKALISNEEI